MWGGEGEGKGGGSVGGGGVRVHPPRQGHRDVGRRACMAKWERGGGGGCGRGCGRPPHCLPGRESAPSPPPVSFFFCTPPVAPDIADHAPPSPLPPPFFADRAGAARGARCERRRRPLGSRRCPPPPPLDCQRRRSRSCQRHGGEDARGVLSPARRGRGTRPEIFPRHPLEAAWRSGRRACLGGDATAHRSLTPPPAPTDQSVATPSTPTRCTYMQSVKRVRGGTRGRGRGRRDAVFRSSRGWTGRLHGMPQRIHSPPPPHRPSLPAGLPRWIGVLAAGTAVPPSGRSGGTGGHGD